MKGFWILLCCAFAISACGTRIASPYDSISDELLTQTYLVLVRIRNDVDAEAATCESESQVREFRRAAINVEVLIERYRARSGFEEAVVRLEHLQGLLTASPLGNSPALSDIGLCSAGYWAEVQAVFGYVWEVEQGKRSSRFEF